MDYSKISKIFLNKIFVECKECNDMYCVPKCSCGSYDVRMTINQTIICSNCGNTLNNLECEEGHKVNINNFDNINVFLIPNSQLYIDIISFLYEEFEMQLDGVFML